MNSKTTFMLALILVTVALPATVATQPVLTRLVTGREGTSGSIVGPDGALYVTEGAGLRAPLAVPRQLGPLVQRMWNASPTFRRQCARLGAAGVTIVVGLDSRMDRATMNAVTSIEVHSGLVQSATTHPRVSEPEYLAHEIEHVLEQVDGVDVRGSARKGLDGVREAHAGAFETARAIAIGRVVAQEVAGWDGDR